MSISALYHVKLLKLYCYRQDENDGDEVFLMYSENRVWPEKAKYYKIGTGEQIINVVIENVKSDAILSIELWDYDFISSNDKLGLFTMLINEKGGPFKTDMLAYYNGGPKYSLEWEVI